MSATIRDMTHSNVEECVRFCHGVDYSDWYSEEYARTWRKEIEQRVKKRIEWASRALDEIGSCAKLAYHDGQLVGILWYFPTYWIPYPDPAKNERVVFIQCTDVRPKYRRKGIGSALIQSLIRSCRKPHHFFHGERPEAIEVYVYPPAEWPAGSKNFLEKQGFKVKRENVPEMYGSTLLRYDLIDDP